MDAIENRFMFVKDAAFRSIREELGAPSTPIVAGAAIDARAVPYAPILEGLVRLVLCDDIVLHGSAAAGIGITLEPRQSNDAAKESGNRCAVYATVDVEAALMHAVFDRRYARATLGSYTFGYSTATGRRLYRATDNLYELFMMRDPLLCVDGYVHVLLKDEFVRPSDTLTEYHSTRAQRPLWTIQVSRRIGASLFMVGRGVRRDTVVRYSGRDRLRVQAHQRRVERVVAESGGDQ